MKNINISFLSKCFISYLLITLVLLAVQLYSFREVTAESQQTYADQIQNALDQNAEALSRDLSSLYYFPKTMDISDHFRELKMENRIYAPQHSRYISYTMNNLSNQIPYFPPLSDVSIHFRSSGICVTPHSFYMSLGEWSIHYKYEHTDIMEFIQAKPSGNKSLQLLPAETVAINGAPDVTYLTCVLKESSDFCTYVFLMDYSRVVEYFQLPSLPDDIYLEVIGNDGSLLLESGEPMEEDIVSFQANIPSINALVKVRVPQAFFDSMAQQIQQKIYSLLLVNLLLGLVLSFALAKMTTTPVRRLIRSHEIPEEMHAKNELVTIYNYLSQSNEQKQSMRDKLLSSLFTRAFSGLPVNADDFAEVLGHRNFFAGPARIAVARYRNAQEQQEFHSLMLYQLKENMPRNFIIEPLNSQEIGLIFPAEEEAVCALRDYLSNVNQELEAGSQIICGISAPFTSFDTISTAVRQALFSLPTKQETFVIFSGEDAPAHQPQSLDYKEFQSALFEWNVKKVEALFREYADIAMKVSPTAVQEMFYTLLAFLRDAADAVQLPSDFLNDVSFKKGISGDSNIQTLQSVTNYLFELKTANQPGEKKLRNREVIHYIHNHFSDPSLSAATVSALYELSERTINTILNEETGMGFAHYLTSVRMQRAAELLRDTSDDVQTVATSCGLTLSTMYRNFKKHYNMTPAEYKAHFSAEKIPAPEEPIS